MRSTIFLIFDASFWKFSKISSWHSIWVSLSNLFKSWWSKPLSIQSSLSSNHFSIKTWFIVFIVVLRLNICQPYLIFVFINSYFLLFLFDFLFTNFQFVFLVSFFSLFPTNHKVLIRWSFFIFLSFFLCWVCIGFRRWRRRRTAIWTIRATTRRWTLRFLFLLLFNLLLFFFLWVRRWFTWRRRWRRSRWFIIRFFLFFLSFRLFLFFLYFSIRFFFFLFKKVLIFIWRIWWLWFILNSIFNLSFIFK